MSDFVMKSCYPSSLQTDISYLQVFANLEYVEINGDFVTTVMYFYLPEDDDNRLCFGIQPKSKNEAFFKSLEGFKQDPYTKQWAYSLPGEKIVKCVPEHQAITNLTIFLEKAMKSNREKSLAFIFLNDKGGLPLLLKSMIENNVTEDFLKKIHGVGDVLTALGLQNEKYKDKDFVQKKYKAALKQYYRVVDRWPDSAIEEDAMWQIGECLFFNRVILPR